MLRHTISRTPAYYLPIPNNVCEVMGFILDGAGGSTCPDATAFANSIPSGSSFFRPVVLNLPSHLNMVAHAVVILNHSIILIADP